MIQPEVWRKVDGQAVRCTSCEKNVETVLKDENDMPVGVQYRCCAEDEVCIFLKTKIDDQRTYSDFREVFTVIKTDLQDAVQENAGGEED